VWFEHAAPKRSAADLLGGDDVDDYDPDTKGATEQ
jgi:hypothetical protein